MLTVRYAEQLADALERLTRPEQQAVMEIIRGLPTGRYTGDGWFALYGGAVYVQIEVRGDEILVTNCGRSVGGMM